MMRFQINLTVILAALVFFGCNKPVFTKFLIQSKTPDLMHFYESGVRVAVFPLQTREYVPLDFHASAVAVEEVIRANQGHLTLVPFEEILRTVSDSDAVGTLVAALNYYYKKGDINPREVVRLSRLAEVHEPDFFLFLKLERADLYRDLKREYKIQLTVSGKLYHIRSKSVVLSFLCTSFSKSVDKKNLPSLDGMVDLTLSAMAKGLPYDTEKAMRREKGADWQGR